MFYRALHTISTQKFRLPVRRYIFDLFSIELDADVVRQLAESAVALRAPHEVLEEPGELGLEGQKGEESGEDEDGEERTVEPVYPHEEAKEEEEEKAKEKSKVYLDNRALRKEQNQCKQTRAP